MSDVANLEDAFCTSYGVSYALALCSGTAAYLAALLALDLPPKSELLLSAYGWPQLLAVPAAIGLKAKLVDCDAAGRISPEAVERAIGPRTRVIVACHLFGNPADARALAGLAARHNLHLLEDCSQALLASQQGRLVGRWGDLSFASLGAAKMLSAGEGGLLFTNRLDLLTGAARVSQHHALWRGSSADSGWLWQSLSLRMHPAGARRAQRELKDWPDRAAHVHRLHCRLRQWLAEEPLLELPDVLPGVCPVWQHFPMVATAPGAARALAPFRWDRQPAYLLKDSPAWPQARRFARWVSFLETGREWAKLRDHDADAIAQKIRGVLRGATG